MQALLAISLPLAVVLSLGLPPLLSVVFDFGAEGTQLLTWVSRGFLAGLAGQCLMELAVRSFYARQEALTPMITAMINLVVFITLGILLSRWLGAPGISLADSLAFTSQAVLLLILLSRKLAQGLSPGGSLARGLAAVLLGGAGAALVSWLPQVGSRPLLAGLFALAVGGLLAVFPIVKDIRLLLRL